MPLAPLPFKKSPLKGRALRTPRLDFLSELHIFKVLTPSNKVFYSSRNPTRHGVRHVSKSAAVHAKCMSMNFAMEQRINTPETSVRVASAGEAKLTGSTCWNRTGSKGAVHQRGRRWMGILSHDCFYGSFKTWPPQGVATKTRKARKKDNRKHD